MTDPTQPFLSICIPTYNRAPYLREALASIASQARPDLEVVVSDNASTDQTPAVIEDARRSLPRLRYFRNSENLGPDRNYLRVVDLASGRFCWFLGSDDTIAPGGIAAMSAALERGPDIVLCARMECDKAMRPRRRRRWIGATNDRLFDSTRPGGLSAYLSCARELGALFSYLSSIAFRTQAWRSVAYDPRFTGTAYSHVYILLSILHRGARLLSIDAPLVNCRLGNDSFSGGGMLQRLMLDVRGYQLLFDTILSDSPQLYRAAIRAMAPQLGLKRLLVIRSESSKDEWNAVQPQLARMIPHWKLRLVAASPCAIRPLRRIRVALRAMGRGLLG